MLTKIQLNIILSEHNLEETIETILNSAATGETGDGLIFVYAVEEAIRIRTRQRGENRDVPRRHRREEAPRSALDSWGKTMAPGEIKA